MNEISNKEAYIGGILMAFFLALAIYLHPFILDKQVSEIRNYQQALRITTGTEFTYAKNTGVGNVLAYGELYTPAPLTNSEIPGLYSAIQKVTEEYTMHSRLVCSSYDKNGSCESWRTEYYWTWDVVDRESFESPSYRFLGVLFSKSELDLPSYQDSTENFYTSSSVRHYYRTTPDRYMASLFVGFYAQKPVYGIVYKDTKPAQIIEDMQTRIKVMNVFYYLLWMSVTGMVYFTLAYNVLEIE